MGCASERERAASACRINSSMAFEPDSFGSLESGQIPTESDRCDAPIHIQIMDRSNTLAPGAAFACATCSSSAADGNAWSALVGPVKFGAGPPYSPRKSPAPALAAELMPTEPLEPDALAPLVS